MNFIQLKYWNQVVWSFLPCKSDYNTMLISCGYNLITLYLSSPSLCRNTRFTPDMKRNEMNANDHRTICKCHLHSEILIGFVLIDRNDCKYSMIMSILFLFYLVPIQFSLAGAHIFITDSSICSCNMFVLIHFFFLFFF